MIVDVKKIQKRRCEMKSVKERREFLRLLGTGVIGVTSVHFLTSCAKEAKSETEETGLPFPYQELNPSKVGERAYDAYYLEERGCMYSVVEGVLGELRDIIGAPYTNIPTAMAIYGKGGVYGWATLCGALNGAALVISLISKDPKTLIDEVYGWYCREELPKYTPSSPKVSSEIPTSVSGSPLCHNSVEKWLKASNFNYAAHSAERKERCARLSCDVAMKVVELLNQEAEGKFVATFANSDEVKRCLGCHGKSGYDNVHQEKGISCTICHTDKATNHP
jgi:hypothetical protein